jgi:subtilisin family serine protease
MKLLPFILLILPTILNAAPLCPQIRVGLVDTGLNLNDPRLKPHLCPTGHKNFVEHETLNDVNGHGTFVAGLIEQNAGKANYCLLIYKYYQADVPGIVNQKHELEAFKAAVDNGSTIVNFSAGGPNFTEDEYVFIKNHPEVIFVVAAGNEHSNLDIPGNEFYPASLFLDNEKVVESIDKKGKLSTFSNYSTKANKELGESLHSYLPHGRYVNSSGTSFATAIFTGKLVDKLSKSCNSGK